MELNNLGEENPHLLSGFLFRVGHGECIGTKELVEYFAFLSEIKDSLIGMQFVEHRAHISEKIRNLQERKEDVLLREFLEER